MTKNFKFIFLLYITSVLFLSFIIPPFQSPDEFNHFKKAYLLSEGQIILNKQGSLTGGQIDKNLLSYMNLYSQIPFNGNEKFNKQIFKDGYQIKWGEDKTYSNLSNTAPYFPIIYLPQALAIKAGQLLDLKIDLTYRLGKIISLITAFTLFFFAVKKFNITPAIKMLFLLPMFIFLASSSHPDVLFCCLLIYAIGISNQLYKKNNITKPSNPDYLTNYIFLIILCFCIATIKANFILIFILPLMLIVKHKRFLDLIFFILIGMLTIFWFWLIEKYHGPTRPDGIETINKLSVFFNYIPEYIQTILSSYTDAKFYKVYYQSFIGNIGWMDAKIGSAWYYLYFLLILVGIKKYWGSIKTKNSTSLDYALIVCGVGSILLLDLLTFIKWTPIGETEIIHQGRYLYPILILFFSINKFSFDIDERNTLIKTYLPIFLIVLGTLVLNTRILTRYYLS